MSGRRIKALRKEFGVELRRSPNKAVFNIRQEVVKPDEFRKYKKNARNKN